MVAYGIHQQAARLRFAIGQVDHNRPPGEVPPAQ